VQTAIATIGFVDAPVAVGQVIAFLFVTVAVVDPVGAFHASVWLLPVPICVRAYDA
jgi:hypothetical protein